MSDGEGEGNLLRAGLRLPHELRQYQWQGVSFLYRGRSALLSDEMGLGKTVQAAVAISLVLRDPGYDRALVVVPSSLTLNWERELAAWAPSLTVRRLTGGEDERRQLYQLPVHVLVASYDQIRIDAFDRIPSSAFDLVVLDEAQRVKNRESRTAFACRLIARKRAWALTATPLENSRSDIESIFAFLRPDLRVRGMERAELFRTIEPHILRRRKRDVLPDLPPVIVQDVIMELTEEQQRAYDDAWLERAGALEGMPDPASVATLFAVLTKLKQLCNYDPQTGASSKADALATIVESLNGPNDKLIVFSQYVETLNWLASRLGPIPLETFHGGLSGTERDEMIARFQLDPGPRVLLMSLRAGGVGLNLQAASVVVMYDRWWNPAVEVQAMFRAHRFDRSRPLHVIRFLVRGSVEERIERILQMKQALFEEFVEQAPGANTQPLSRAELLDVLALYEAPGPQHNISH